jgi:hypothetical protein
MRPNIGGSRRRGKVVKIRARIDRDGRYVMFHLAEVAVPRALFAEILRRIDRLRPTPPPLPAWSPESNDRQQLREHGASMTTK